MKAKPGIFLPLVPLVVGLLWLQTACQPRPSKRPVRRDTRQAAFHRAKLYALDLEIRQHRTWIQNTHDPQKRLMYQKTLARLQVERERWQALPPDSVPLPRDSIMVVVTFPHEGCTLGMVLPYEGLSRSGPFYLVTGILGGDCSVLKPKHRYRLTLLPVMPQTYPFPSSYVCIVAYHDLGPAP